MFTNLKLWSIWRICDPHLCHFLFGYTLWATILRLNINKQINCILTLSSSVIANSIPHSCCYDTIGLKGLLSLSLTLAFVNHDYRLIVCTFNQIPTPIGYKLYLALNPVWVSSGISPKPKRRAPVALRDLQLASL